MAPLPRPNLRDPATLSDLYPRDNANPPSIDWDEYTPLPFGEDSQVLLGDRVHFDRA